MINFEFIGNIGATAELKSSKNGDFIGFSVAVNQRKKNADGQWENVTKWISCTRHGQQGVDKYLVKGQQVYIRGEVGTNAYIDKNGNARADLVCYVREIELLGSRSENNAEPTRLAEPTPSISKAFQDFEND